ncbi:PTS glucose transporter subunit IIA [Enterococcus avium]|uniref:PTS sugar transporter subunit IIA n=1 Tax=Enterococcus avium TaxID=33945 RepID=UPI0022E2418C|nr:PTS glucose transporter subunit IIA [Enterococcus avium]
MSLIKHLLKKANIERRICSPASGEITEITKLSDDVFSQKMMGEGFFVKPEEQEICEIVSPLSGIITNIFETKHAITIHNEEVDVLLHLGIDTVEMKGLPFDLMLRPNQSVTEGQIIAKMDVAKIVNAGKTPEIIVVFPELSEEKWKLEKNGNVAAGEQIGKINF